MIHQTEESTIAHQRLMREQGEPTRCMHREPEPLNKHHTGHLRGHIIRRATERERAVLNDPALVDERDLFGKPKVHDLDVAVRRNKQILWLEIAVAVPQSVDVFEGQNHYRRVQRRVVKMHTTELPALLILQVVIEIRPQLTTGNKLQKEADLAWGQEHAIVRSQKGVLEVLQGDDFATYVVVLPGVHEGLLVQALERHLRTREWGKFTGSEYVGRERNETT
jgi:hypothetical protein